MKSPVLEIIFLRSCLSTFGLRLNRHGLGGERREHITDDQVNLARPGYAGVYRCGGNFVRLPVHSGVVAGLPVTEVVVIHQERLKVLVATCAAEDAPGDVTRTLRQVQ